MKSIKDLDIAVGLCERDGLILMLQRKDDNPMWDKKWEFPGGKIEAGEDPEVAVVREVREETNLPVVRTSFFKLHDHDWHLEDKILRVHIHCFYCEIGEGDFVHESDKAYQAGWFTKDEALALDSLEANNEILNAYFA